jgi:hypothetical protein
METQLNHFFVLNCLKKRNLLGNALTQITKKPRMAKHGLSHARVPSHEAQGTPATWFASFPIPKVSYFVHDIA